jgi:hypothetical protein
MPDPVLMLQAMLIAAVVAMATTGLVGWLVKAKGIGAGWSTFAAVLGLGLGFGLGCFWLDIKIHWPPREDQDRLLEIVVPAVIVVEMLAAWPKGPSWMIGGLRLAVVCLTARVLLNGTVYLEDLAGPRSREWSPGRAWLILGGMAVALAVSWWSMVRITKRAPSASPVLALAGVIAAAALTIMLSGYATGGLVGLPLASGLAGVAVVMVILPETARPKPPVGVGVVGLFSLVVVGRFFGQLTTGHAVLLLAAPMLAWVPELPYLVQMPGWGRALARLGAVAALALGVLFFAQREFAVSYSSASSSGHQSTSAEDYRNLGR